MVIAFGRLVVGGVTLDDLYQPKLDELRRFEVISDAGPRYGVERSSSRGRSVWHVSRMDPLPAIRIGIVRRGGNFLNRWYSYTCDGHRQSSGTQNILVNAIFGLIGEREDVVEFRFNN